MKPTGPEVKLLKYKVGAADDAEIAYNEHGQRTNLFLCVCPVANVKVRRPFIESTQHGDRTDDCLFATRNRKARQ